MMEMSFDMNLSGKTLRLLAKMPDKVSEALDISLIRCRNEMKNISQRLAPKRTGTLARSISGSPVSGFKTTVGTNLVYARIHDLGGMTGRGHRTYIPPYRGVGYFTPAYNMLKDSIMKQIVNEEFSAILR